MAEVINQGSFTPDNLIAGSNELLVTEEILVARGQNLTRGSVLGRVKHSTPSSGTPDGNTGNGTCMMVTGGPKTKIGRYRIFCTRAAVNSGEFQVRDPAGKFVGSVLITGGASGIGDFKSDEINFRLRDGTTDFAVGDSFFVDITEGVPDVGTPKPGNIGDGTAFAVEGRRYLKVGIYTMTCITAVSNGGVFSVVDPDGLILPIATVGIAYDSNQIAFRIVKDTSDFAVGDVITVEVTIHPRQCKLLDKGATDGSSEPYCVLSETINATFVAKYSIGYLQGQFNERALLFASGTDIEDVRDAMRKRNMYSVASVARGN